MRTPRWKFIATAPLAAALLFGVLGAAPAPAAAQSQTSDVVAQACTLKSPVGATFDARWKTGLSLNTDQVVLGEEIVAYRIQWFDGVWSDEWYTPGVNDVDWVDSNRRVWSYFYDHTHEYISCG